MKIHWTTWERLCSPKEDEGLGFKDFRAFNQAMLAKQCWRLIVNSESLAAKVLKSRYYAYSSFLQAGLGRRPSFICKASFGEER